MVKNKRKKNNEQQQFALLHLKVFLNSEVSENAVEIRCLHGKILRISNRKDL